MFIAVRSVSQTQIHHQQPVHPVSYQHHVSSPLPPVAPSYTTWNVEHQPTVLAGSQFTENYGLAVSSSNPATTNEYDQSELCPIAVPTSLRPISKGIKRSPSAGIISALAAAESMARADSSTNASASPAPSVSGDRMPSVGGLPSMGSIGGGGSSSALPTLPGAYTQTTAAAVIPPPAPETEYVATSFAVCNAPLFTSTADGPSEFDAIADSADALDSFNLDDGIEPSNGGSTWLPPAQAWQSPSAAAAAAAVAPQPEHRLPAAAVPEPIDSVQSIEPVLREYQYTASPSPSPVPPPPKFEQQGHDEDFFAQIGDGGPEMDNIGVDAAINEGLGTDFKVEEAPFVNEQPVAEPQQQVENQVENLEECGSVVADVQAQQEEVTNEHAPGSTWYDDAGYCYYLSEDGWKYFWDATTQQWSAHEYLGTGGASASGGGGGGGGDASKQGDAVNVQAVVQDVTQTEHVPVKEASFCEYADGSVPPLAAVALPASEEDTGIADWNSNEQHVQSNSVQYNHYEQQQQQNSFLPQQQHQVADAHNQTPPSATFVPSTHHQPTHEHASMHSSPYMQPNTTAAAPTWGAAAPTASPVHHHHHHYQSPQQYQHQQKSLHPSCGFAKLCFGGRLVRVSPSGTITTHLLSALPEDVLRPVGGAGGTVSMASRSEMLNAFPGPLGTTLNKEKAAAFFSARKEACVGEEPGSDAAAMHTLWSVLEVQALHPHTKTANASPRPSSGNESNNHPVVTNGAAINTGGADAALAAALRHDGAPAAISSTTNTAANTPSPAALQSIQDLILNGRKSDAFQAAIQCHAWPLALILARSLGLTEWQSAVESYAAAALSPASPLSTVCMLTSGAGARSIPDPTTNPAAAAQVLGTWRQHAAALAVGHIQGAEQALEALGEALLVRGCITQAHTCFVLAGVPLQPSDSATSNHQYAVVGASRTLAPRTYSALPAILRTEIFTWSRTVGMF
jgi:hypothetical protein